MHSTRAGLNVRGARIRNGFSSVAMVSMTAGMAGSSETMALKARKTSGAGVPGQSLSVIDNLAFASTTTRVT